MTEEKSKKAVEKFGDMFKEFGEAVTEIFDDSELGDKAKEFSDSLVNSAKAFGARFKDEDVKDKFKDVGKAAQEFGKSVSDFFKENKK